MNEKKFSGRLEVEVCGEETQKQLRLADAHVSRFCLRFSFGSSVPLLIVSPSEACYVIVIGLRNHMTAIEWFYVRVTNAIKGFKGVCVDV